MMLKTCKQCGHKWISRSDSPLRCPKCKSTRWAQNIIHHQCKRCGFNWTQRGDETPRYCPACHSSMWAEEKRIFTCPKCGRTRTLRSNSRNNMCPFCDRYGNIKASEEFPGPNGNKLMQPIHIWSDGEGLVMVYSQNGTGIASIYENGRLVATVNLDFWFRTHSYSPESALQHINDPMMQKEIGVLVKQSYSSRNKHMPKTERIRDSKNVGSREAEALALFEDGMNMTAISLKLNMPFSEVFNCINKAPRIESRSAHARRRVDEFD